MQLPNPLRVMIVLFGLLGFAQTSQAQNVYPLAQYGKDPISRINLSQMVVDDEGTIFVNDTDSGTLRKLSPDGRILLNFGISGSTISVAGPRLYVVDIPVRRVSVYAKINGELLFSFGGEDMRVTGTCKPKSRRL